MSPENKKKTKIKERKLNIKIPISMKSGMSASLWESPEK